MAYINYPVTFDGNDLAKLVSGLTVLAVNSYLMPKRGITINDLSRSDKSKHTNAFYKSKDITVSIGISRDTRANAEASLDTLFTYIQGLEKQLVINEGGAGRSYTATYSDYVLKVGGGSYIELDLIFTTTDRFGYGIPFEQLLLASARTLYNYTDTLTFNGNAQAQVPVITITISALSGSTTNIVSLTNPGTTQGITVSRAWTAGDVLQIDCKNRTVRVNGVDVDFTGAFPEWSPGTGYLNYQDNFLTRTFNISVYYYRRYV